MGQHGAQHPKCCTCPPDHQPWQRARTRSCCTLQQASPSQGPLASAQLLNPSHTQQRRGQPCCSLQSSLGFGSPTAAGIRGCCEVQEGHHKPFGASPSAIERAEPPPTFQAALFCWVPGFHRNCRPTAMGNGKKCSASSLASSFPASPNSRSSSTPALAGSCTWVHTPGAKNFC